MPRIAAGNAEEASSSLPDNHSLLTGDVVDAQDLLQKTDNLKRKRSICCVTDKIKVGQPSCLQCFVLLLHRPCSPKFMSDLSFEHHLDVSWNNYYNNYIITAMTQITITHKHGKLISDIRWYQSIQVEWTRAMRNKQSFPRFGTDQQHNSNPGLCWLKGLHGWIKRMIIFIKTQQKRLCWHQKQQLQYWYAIATHSIDAVMHVH